MGLDLAARTAAAGDPGRDPEDLCALASDPEPAVRAAVAGNPRAPYEAIDRLHFDDTDLVADVLWRRTDLPLEAYRWHGRRHHAQMRRLAADPNTRREVVFELCAGDSDFDVREIAVTHPSLTDEDHVVLAHYWSYRVRFGVARSGPLPPGVPELYAFDRHWTMRTELAYRAEVAPDLLRELALDEAADVRCAAAGNPNTPEDALAWLAEDTFPWVRLCVARNRSAPPAVRAAAEASLEGYSLPEPLEEGVHPMRDMLLSLRLRQGL